MNESQQIDVLSSGTPVPERYHVIENPHFRSWIAVAADRLCTAAAHARTAGGSACAVCYRAAETYAVTHAPADRVMSNTSINGQPYTWQQLAERERERSASAEQLVTVLFDLDRCEHGRHEGDVCSDCGGPSLGNPIINASIDERAYPRQLGFGISGGPIVFPERDLRNPEAWRVAE